ncbi:MAG: hypothetical protein Q4C68_03455 [Moraxella sp.]|nr:hypothetical protein [Moraxella sp.]
MKTYINLSALLLGLLFCQFSQANNSNLQSKQTTYSSKPTNLTQSRYQGFNKNDLPLTISQISAKEFNTALESYDTWSATIAIDDLPTAKQTLKDVVWFDKDGLVKKIHFRNGGVYRPTFTDAWFVAYFPDEDILLLEGGHTSDVSFHLGTGKQTKNTGNPYQIAFSPNQKYRINAYDGGQDCSYYFIEEKQAHGWQKIIEINDVFDSFIKSTPDNFVTPCQFNAKFWTTDNTLYLGSIDIDIPNFKNHYYKVTLKQPPKTPIYFNLKKQPLPFNIDIGFDNYDTLPKIDAHTANRLFAGLYPKAKDIRLAYRFGYSNDFDTVAITFLMDGESEMMTNLYTINKQGQIIDELLIAYDEIAESAHKTTAVLSKHDITVMEETSYQDTHISISQYRIDKHGRFILKSQSQNIIKDQ